MTQAEIKLCSLLLQEHFGEIVDKIGTHLIRTGSQPLRAIVHDTGTSLDQVKKALCVLIQHNLVTYQIHKRGIVEYEAHCSRILRILRYPRYIYTAKTLYSDTGELIVEELLLNGKMTMSAVVKKVADRLTETMEGKATSGLAMEIQPSQPSPSALYCLSYRWENHGLLRGIQHILPFSRHTLCTTMPPRS